MTTYQTTDGREYIVRQPTADDAGRITAYSKKMFASTDQTLTLLEEYNPTEDQQRKYIQDANANPAALLLLAELEGEIISFLFFFPGAKQKIAHSGEFGISVDDRVRGLGIGRVMIQSLLDWARKNAFIEKVYLKVFSTNEKAIGLYKSLGFVEEGRHIKAIKQPSGEYVDSIQMYVDTTLHR